MGEGRPRRSCGQLAEFHLDRNLTFCIMTEATAHHESIIVQLIQGHAHPWRHWSQPRQCLQRVVPSDITGQPQTNQQNATFKELIKMQHGTTNDKCMGSNCSWAMKTRPTDTDMQCLADNNGSKLFTPSVSLQTSTSIFHAI